MKLDDTILSLLRDRRYSTRTDVIQYNLGGDINREKIIASLWRLVDSRQIRLNSDGTWEAILT